MREKETNQKAEFNTLQFLREANQLAEQGKLKAVNWLSKKYGLSNNTGWACKQLDILTYEDGLYKWVPKAEPSRKMCLEILEVLLERSKKKVTPPAIDGFASSLDKLTTEIKDATHAMLATAKSPVSRMLGRALNQPQMSAGGLFAEAETKDKKRFEVFNSTLAALLTGRPLEELTAPNIELLNEKALLITDNAMNRLFANQ